MDDDEIQVVGTAEDGVETLGMIEETEPDLLLLDLIMPKLDGLGVMERLQEKQKMKLKFVHPEQFDEAAEIADSLRAHQAVLMNLEMTETDTARRLLDFLSGAAYALGGRVMRVSAQAYIIAPTNVDLVGDAVADFESAGLYF